MRIRISINQKFNQSLQYSLHFFTSSSDNFITDISSFQAFFNYIDMRILLENFCVYHVNAPGQEEGAPTLPEK